MTVTRQEIADVMENNRSFFDSVNTKILVGKDNQITGMASGTRVKIDNKKYLITCNHVTKNSEYVFGNPQEENSGISNNDTLSAKRHGLNILSSDKSQDYSIIEDCGGGFHYDLSQNTIDKKLLKKNLSTCVYIFGYPGFLTDVVSEKSGSVFSYSKSYGAAGPLVKCGNNWIIADFAEKELMGSRAFSDLSDVKIELSGGVRDLKGMSGSPAWMQSEGGTMSLIGIVSGREKSSINQHLVKIVPIWNIINGMNNLLNKTA